MSGTFRLRLVYLEDGVLSYGGGRNARNARAKNKDIDRRIKRREHSSITREAVRSFYEDQEFDVLDTIEYDEYLNGDGGLYDDHPDWGDYNDNQDDYYEHDYYDPIDYDDYSYMDDWYSSRSWVSLYVREEEPEDRILKQEDVGKTLADILEEINTRKYK